MIGCIPLGIRVRYDQQGGRILVLVGPITIAAYPRNKSATGKKKQSSKKENFESEAHIKKKQGNTKDFFPLVRLVIDFLRDFHSKLRINHLYFKAILADQDPCDLSINYGRAWAAAGNLMPLLDRYFIIRERNIEIECDYTAATSQIDLSVDFTITVARLLTLGVYHGWRVLRKYLQITNKVKDGATL